MPTIQLIKIMHAHCNFNLYVSACPKTSVNKVIVTASNDIRTGGLGNDVDGKGIFVHLLTVVPNLEGKPGLL